MGLANLKKGDIVKYGEELKYAGNRYVVLDVRDNEVLLRPLMNPYGGPYSSSPMSYPDFKVQLSDPKLSTFNEEKGTCCGRCGHVHAKGTSCPKPFLTGKSHCSKRTNEMHTMDHDGADEFHQVRADVEEEKNGLWANIRAKKARGEKPSPKGSEAYKKAVAAGKKINAMNEIDETDEYCPHCLAEYITECWNSGTIEEAEYRGRKVTLGKPFLTPGGPKKRSVYVKNAKGNVVKVNFGDPNMRIKKSNPKRRKSYRARHHCENPGPRWKANYWSCRAW